jgi:CheY-like chemotaxis protein
MTDDLRVLVVDEDRDVLELTQTFLEREGDMTVATARSGAAAVERVEAEPFDAVVGDYRMPEMDGVELAAEIADRRPDLPYVLYTARPREAFDRDLAATAVTEHVEKDVGSDQYATLAETIRTLAADA